MVKKVVRVMMPTCSALMRTDLPCRRPSQACPLRGELQLPGFRKSYSGLTLVELLLVVSIMALFVLMAQLNLYGLLRKSTFKGQVQELISTFQMAARGAAESSRRYEVIIDLTEQSYMLREITSLDLSEVLEEEIIVENDLSDNCRVEYVMFDDEHSTDHGEGRARFRAGHNGWQYGGKIVLLDEDERIYSVVVSRLDRFVRLVEGDAELLLPRSEDEMFF